MPDREKVIKGLECHAKGSKGCLFDCPYGNENGCQLLLCSDAIALLKEQEAMEPVFEQGSMVCGECGHDVIVQRLIGDEVFDEKVSYCPACGRSVKWE